MSAGRRLWLCRSQLSAEARSPCCVADGRCRRGLPDKKVISIPAFCVLLPDVRSAVSVCLVPGLVLAWLAADY